jgi:glutamyl-tRNA synthetase
VGEVHYDADALKKLVPKGKTPRDTAKTLRALLEEHLDPLLDWRVERLESILRSFCETTGWTPQEAFMTVRIAVTGRAASPPLFETMTVLGKEVCRQRMRRAIEKMKDVKA